MSNDELEKLKEAEPEKAMRTGDIRFLRIVAESTLLTVRDLARKFAAMNPNMGLGDVEHFLRETASQVGIPRDFLEKNT